jgi:uncharacterized protein YcfJ
MTGDSMDSARSTFVIGAVKPRERVNRIVEQARVSGISPDYISIISPDDRRGRDPADEKPRENADKLHDTAIGAVAGGVAIGALGCIVGIASIAVPGLGFLIVGGPLAAALGDAIVGGAIGAIAGGLLGMRVPEHRAKVYEESLRKGSTIISIHADNREQLERARELLADARAEEILEVNADAISNSTQMS